MWISHRKEIRKLTFRALALRRSESTLLSSITIINPYLLLLISFDFSTFHWWFVFPFLSPENHLSFCLRIKRYVVVWVEIQSSQSIQTRGQTVNGLNTRVSVVRMVWSSGWGWFWKELLLATGVSTTWAEVIFRVEWMVFVSRRCYKSGLLNVIGHFSHNDIGRTLV